MRIFSAKIALAVLVLVMGAMLSGCPKEENGTDPSGKKLPEAARELDTRLKHVDILYQIMQKDNPPQTETYDFRQWTVEAREALRKGDYEKAERLTNDAEVYIKFARQRYYDQHKDQVKSGKSGATGEELMNLAYSLMEKAEQSYERGEAWKSERYYEAAIEQGELALLAEMRSAEQAVELMRLSDRLTAVYNAAGKAEEAGYSKQRVITHVLEVLSNLEADITACVKGKAPQCQGKVLAKDQDKFNEVHQKLIGANRIRNSIIKAGQDYAPGRIRARDYTNDINSWQSNWNVYWNRGVAGSEGNGDEPDDPPVDNERERMIREDLARHSQMATGAVPADGTGISLVETNIYVQGDKVVIKGKLSNFMDESIFNPRVTIVGSAMSEVKNLGFNRMNPLITTTFSLTLKYYNAEAYQRSNYRLPPHSLLLIYRDINGREVKVTKKMK